MIWHQREINVLFCIDNLANDMILTRMEIDWCIEQVNEQMSITRHWLGDIRCASSPGYNGRAVPASLCGRSALTEYRSMPAVF